jgi:hypothetical protein
MKGIDKDVRNKSELSIFPASHVFFSFSSRFFAPLSSVPFCSLPFLFAAALPFSLVGFSASSSSSSSYLSCFDCSLIFFRGRQHA